MRILSILLLSALAVVAPIKAILLTVLVFILADLVLGIMAARKRGQRITSAGIRRTIVKLFVYELVVVLLFLGQKYLLGDSLDLTKWGAALIGVTELLSVLENADTITGGSVFKAITSRLKLESESRKGPPSAGT